MMRNLNEAWAHIEKVIEANPGKQEVHSLEMRRCLNMLIKNRASETDILTFIELGKEMSMGSSIQTAAEQAFGKVIIKKVG